MSTPHDPNNGAPDAVVLGEHCLRLASAHDSAPVNEDTTAAVVAVRDLDGLLFVTVPAQVEAISSSWTVLMDGAVYCYLDPGSLEAVRDENYVATGFLVGLLGEQYETYLNTPDPPTSLLD